MNKAEAKDILKKSNTAALVDLNDWAVNTVREYAHGIGRNPVSIMAEEATRISTAGTLNVCAPSLDDYLRMSRAGSQIRLNRKIRLAVYAVFATRMALANRL